MYDFLLAAWSVGRRWMGLIAQHPNSAAGKKAAGARSHLFSVRAY
jgi:hypothetical protein